ncbi:MAG: Tol-Pal system protein TolB, partial [Hydrocarboniphaga effusa]|nr:Tol-Pal system protein TolB [Hydrocarboniphaga effusa]
MKHLRWIALSLLMVCGAVRAELEITVTGGDVAPIPIALVPFAQIPEVQLDIAQVVENDLVR